MSDLNRPGLFNDLVSDAHAAGMFSNDSARIQAAVDAGDFVVIEYSTVYCRATDAILGTDERMIRTHICYADASAHITHLNAEFSCDDHWYSITGPESLMKHCRQHKRSDEEIALDELRGQVIEGLISDTDDLQALEDLEEEWDEKEVAKLRREWRERPDHREDSWAKIRAYYPTDGWAGRLHG